jgi:hypothetical protein
VAATVATTVFLANVRQADVHGRHREDRLARRTVRSAPPNAVIIGHGDGRIFPLWYEYHVRSGRSDLAIIDRNLLPHDWYAGRSARFDGLLRWAAGFDLADGKRNNPRKLLRALVKANLGHRPIVALARYPELRGFCRGRNGVLHLCGR